MRADRLINIVLLLQTHGRMTAQALAQQLEVTERTIYRDIAALGQAGIPVVTESGPGGGCALLDGYRTKLTGLSVDEIQALFPAHAAGPVADLGLAAALRSALLKLAATLPDAMRHQANAMSQRIYLDPTGWFHGDESTAFLSLAQAALWSARQLHIFYRRSDNALVERVVDPYGLVARGAIWYLVGNVAGDLRVFRLSRIRQATLLDAPSQRPTSFDLPAFWAEWSRDFEGRTTPFLAEMRLAPAGLALLPEILGEPARAILEEAPIQDAAGWRLLTLPFGSFEHARTIALGLSGLAEVLAPTELRASIRAVAEQVVGIYDDVPASEAESVPSVSS